MTEVCRVNVVEGWSVVGPLPFSSFLEAVSTPVRPFDGRTNAPTTTQLRVQTDKDEEKDETNTV
jgi:hypothetical protein